MRTVTIYAGNHGHNLLAIENHSRTYYGKLHVKQDSDKTRLYLADIETPHQELDLPQRRYNIDSAEFKRDVLAAIDRLERE